MEFPLVESLGVWTTPLFVVAELPSYPSQSETLLALVRQRQLAQTNPVDSQVAEFAKQGLHESRLDFLASDEPPLVALRRELETLILACAEEMNAGYWPEGAEAEASITESWYHVTQDGGYHDVHSHPNCSWCGIYCLQEGSSTLEGRNGVNRFYDPRINAEHYLDAGTQYLNSEGVWDIAPRNGQVVIFPSYLKHSALPYKGKDDRIVIAFNASVNFTA